LRDQLPLRPVPAGLRVSTVVLLAAIGIGAALAPATGLASTPTYQRALPAPAMSGHAQLYGWGAATMPDGSVIVGDYWNHRVVHYATDGTYLGVLFNDPVVPTVYSAPYGLAVDPNNGTVYVGFQCCAVEKWTRNRLGKYIRNSMRMTAPGFNYPSRVAVDRQSNVYVSDMMANRIFVFNPAGTYQFSWGSLGSGVAQFNQPRGIGLDQSTPQRLYIADSNNKRIDVIDTSNGNFLPYFGTGHLNNDLRGLAIDSVNGFVYVVDDAANTTRKFDLNGNWIQDIGSAWVTNGRTCCAPDGMFSNGGREATVDGLGQLWVGDMPNFRVQVFNTAGSFVRSAPSPASLPPGGAFNGPRGVAVDPAGNVLVSDTYNFRVQKFDSTGAFTWAQGIRGRDQYALNYPMGITVDPADSSFLLVDSYNNAIKKFAANGDIIWTYTGKASTALNHPQGIALGTGGAIYVADTLNGRIAVLNQSGVTPTFVTSIGCRGTGTQCLRQPYGVHFDSTSGDLYIVDWMNGTLLEYTASGAWVRTIATRGVGPSQLQTPYDVEADATSIYVSDSNLNQVKQYARADGSLITTIGTTGSGDGQLNSPMGLALAAGVLYIADQGNDRISEWSV
jgi:tripartite motif-containing protein 71